MHASKQQRSLFTQSESGSAAELCVCVCVCFDCKANYHTHCPQSPPGGPVWRTPRSLVVVYILACICRLLPEISCFCVLLLPVVFSCRSSALKDYNLSNSEAPTERTLAEVSRIYFRQKPAVDWSNIMSTDSLAACSCYMYSRQEINSGRAVTAIKMIQPPKDALSKTWSVG